MKSSLPPTRRGALIAELQRNEPRFLRRQTRGYLPYLDRHGSLASRLGYAGVATRIVFGEHDDVGLADDERRTLVPNAGHFTLNQEPGQIAELVLDALNFSGAPALASSQHHESAPSA